LEQLAMVFAFDAVESGERLRFRHRAVPGEPAAIAVDDLVETSAEQPLTAVTRAAHAELFQAVRIGHMEPEADYRHAMVEARRPLGDAARELTVETGCVMRQETLGARAEILLAESWAARETARLVLPPSWLKLEPGDHVTLAIGGKLKSFRIAETSGLLQRSVEARSHDPTIYGAIAVPERPPRADPAAVLGPPAVLVLDLPAASGASEAKAPLVAAAAKPWPQALVVLSDPGGGAYRTECVLRRPAVMGTTLDSLGAGPLWRTDPATMIRVRLIPGRCSRCRGRRCSAAPMRRRSARRRMASRSCNSLPPSWSTPTLMRSPV
jgi:Putative phage tail protein